MVRERSREGRKVGRMVRMLCSSPGSWWLCCDHVMDVEVEEISEDFCYDSAEHMALNWNPAPFLLAPTALGACEQNR